MQTLEHLNVKYEFDAPNKERYSGGHVVAEEDTT